MAAPSFVEKPVPTLDGRGLWATGDVESRAHDVAFDGYSFRTELARSEETLSPPISDNEVGTVKLTLREQAGAAGMTSPFESRGARDGVPSEERATS